MSLKKQPQKNGKVRVLFTVLPETARGAKVVQLVGEFNDWNVYATPLKKQWDGSFVVALELAPGREYQFRYLMDEVRWENDRQADKHVPTPFGDAENSVVAI